jgi:ATP/maltotriose-dependent transcriptional regulator MalT/CheY-like chemotaxis protein
MQRVNKGDHMTTTTNILLVDDHPMLRKGLRLLIESEEGLSVVGEANDGQEAIDQVRELTPDIVVMDINMPNLNGIDATRQILAESPQSRVLALSIHSGKQYVENMLEAGAVGYLLKESAPEELIKAIRVIREGKSYLSADITEIVLSRLRHESGTGKASTINSQRLVGKLQRPGLATTNVHRAQLIEKLEAGCEKKLTLVTAPAGYGKTALISDWLTHSDIPSAWLTVDSDDNALRPFLESLLAAIRALFPEVCPNVQTLVEAANQPPVSILAEALTNDIEQGPHRFILTIDDYHLIEDKSVHDLLSQLLKCPMRQMHLVIISRRGPFLPLPLLRANNDINEIRVNDLLFSVAETTTFLERGLEREIDPETVSNWMERTKGWIAGLQLAIDAAQQSDMVDESAPAESGTRIEASEGLTEWREILTNREYEILLLLEQRLSDKEIADQLCISTDTVRTHNKNIRGKLNANSRRDAVAKAIALKILSPN